MKQASLQSLHHQRIFSQKQSAGILTQSLQPTPQAFPEAAFQWRNCVS